MSVDSSVQAVNVGLSLARIETMRVTANCYTYYLVEFFAYSMSNSVFLLLELMIDVMRKSMS